MVWVTVRGRTWNIKPMGKHGEFVFFRKPNLMYRGGGGPEYFYFIAHKSRSGKWKGCVERMYEKQAEMLWKKILDGTYKLP